MSEVYIEDRRVCTRCNECKPLSEFSPDRRRSCGVQSRCKKCGAQIRAQRRAAFTPEERQAHIDYCLKYSQENRESMREKNRLYNAENRERRLQKDREYYANNKDKRRAYRARRKEAILQQQRGWQKRNKPRLRAYVETRRAKRQGNGGSFTPEEWESLKSKYDQRCLCCGKVKPLCADHIVPVTKPGGHSYIENIQPLCASCNSKKRMEVIDFRPGKSCVLERAKRRMTQGLRLSLGGSH